MPACAESMASSKEDDRFGKNLGRMERHDLFREFPEHKSTILQLREGSRSFSRKFDEYNQLDEQIYRIETGAENTSDEYLNELRLKRVHLKDELYRQMLAW